MGASFIVPVLKYGQRIIEDLMSKLNVFSAAVYCVIRLRYVCGILFVYSRQFLFVVF